MSREPIDTSVVIPAYNEESRVGATLAKIVRYLDGRGAGYEVLVVDDGSSDATAEVAGAAESARVRVLRLPHNQGKGAAVRRGVLESRGARVLLTDADLSTPIEDLAKLEARLAGCELVLGSRAVADANVTLHQPFYRELMGKTFNKLIRLAGVRGLSDTQCGFKLIEGEAARRLFGEILTPGFAFDVELVWLARRHGYGIAEVGVTWKNSPISRVRPWIDSPHMLFEIARFRWLHRGRFRR